jgi:hypothetical protein
MSVNILLGTRYINGETERVLTMITFLSHEGDVENERLKAYTATEPSNDLVGIDSRGDGNERPAGGQKSKSNDLE